MDALLEELARFEGEPDPPPFEASLVCTRAAAAARTLVEEMERLGTGEDRLGQLVRNLFECLGLAREGAEISLRAGENPVSLLRPS
jgi:hypothetical protein